jgi:hypothetical protein
MCSSDRPYWIERVPGVLDVAGEKVWEFRLGDRVLAEIAQYSGESDPSELMGDKWYVRIENHSDLADADGYDLETAKRVVEGYYRHPGVVAPVLTVVQDGKSILQ